MITANLNEFKTHLSAYASRVKAGETVVVCERNKPIAEFRPITPPVGTPRPEPGLFREQIRVGEEFFAEDVRLEGDFYAGSASEK